MPRFFRADSTETVNAPKQPVEKFTTLFVLELPSLIGLFLFFAASYLIFVTFAPGNLPFLRLVFFAFLIFITLLRLVKTLSRLLFAPRSPVLRVVPLDCPISRKIHNLFIGMFGYTIFILMFIVVTRKLGAQMETALLMQFFAASLLIIVTMALVLFYRERVKQQILAAGALYGRHASWGRHQFASIWHILALIYLLILWLLLFSNLTTPVERARGAFLLSFFVVPIWIVADMTLQWIVKYGVATLKIYNEQEEDSPPASEDERELREKGRKTYLRSLLIARYCLVFGMIVWVASLWNIRVPFFSKLSLVMFDALVIMTLALLFWKLISDWIERKIAESIPQGEQEKEEDDEWGSAAARGRSYTLLPMLRKFVGTILMTMVTLTILSAMGVDIGPLLAGAGVVGLAVGFGAQKLVADMFSGFFYLLDDAFRVGEYIEAGGISGVVENISLRNVMLRHHRGMLQIVPHSELGSITNFMRGGIIVKFNLDFPYDADIDKIRKIIKKVGIAMLEDEEFGDNFIKPVKSQGVREISNSVMTIRVKFTAKPGAHFVIRREAYRRITEALRARGIEYAHRKVIVDIPQNPDGTPAASPEQVAKAAGAAAQRIAEEENSAAPKPDPANP